MFKAETPAVIVARSEIPEEMLRAKENGVAVLKDELSHIVAF